jgi:uncharacterized repeat protein (TIGR03803 family)
MKISSMGNRASSAWKLAALCAALIVAAPASALAAPAETVLHSFIGSDGLFPYAGLIADSKGNLYGATSAGGAIIDCNPLPPTPGCGVVFKLSPPATAGGAWTVTVLHVFSGYPSGPDGAFPDGRLIADSKGKLYGTTFGGGASGDGTVFELSPPATAGGAWTETVLYAFCSLANCSDGSETVAGLIADSQGNFYGTTIWGGAPGNGVVFELSPPATAGGALTETVLYAFKGAATGPVPAA